MKLTKVIKKMRELEKKEGISTKVTNKKYPTSKPQRGKGFRAKANSQEGAALQRSMGNRDAKAG